MSTIRTFFVGVAKVALAIFLAVALLSLLGWGVYAYFQHREGAKNAPLATPKTWPGITVLPLDNARFSLSTIWRDSKVSYQFSMIGDPKRVTKARDQQGPGTKAGGKFILTFLDEAGFKLFDHGVPLDDMTRIVDDKGEGTGLQIRGEFYSAADNYRRATSWEITWTF
jgi:hypothetical protein